MDVKDLVFYTDRIPIYQPDGKKIAEIPLKEQIRPVPRRRCGISDSGLYYKGAGIVYTGHFVNAYDDTIKLVAKTGALYEKYNVVYPALFRKFGIFTFCHQPFFSDLEGGCGPKERSLPIMQEQFLYSAIDEIVDVIDTPLPQHSIYVYRMKELTGSYKDTLRLIAYLMEENYNTPWDKNVWDDIACFGYVRDLADWFISPLFCHKLGTVFGLLTALIKKDKYLYEIIARELTGLEQLGDHHIIYLSALIVQKFAPECLPDLDLRHPGEALYRALWEALCAGKACCHLEDEAQWDFVRDQLRQQIGDKVNLAMKDLLYHKIMLRK